MHSKCNVLESSRNHHTTLVRGKIVCHETSPWCPKDWGPLHLTGKEIAVPHLAKREWCLVVCLEHSDFTLCLRQNYEVSLLCLTFKHYLFEVLCELVKISSGRRIWPSCEHQAISFWISEAVFFFSSPFSVTALEVIMAINWQSRCALRRNPNATCATSTRGKISTPLPGSADSKASNPYLYLPRRKKMLK